MYAGLLLVLVGEKHRASVKSGLTSKSSWCTIHNYSRTVSLDRIFEFEN